MGLQAHKVLERAKSLTGNIKDLLNANELSKNIFKSSSHVSIIRVSANISNFCIVHSANSNIYDYLGY